MAMTKEQRAKHCVAERAKQCPTIKLKRKTVMTHLVPCDCWEQVGDVVCQWWKATAGLREYHNKLVKHNIIKKGLLQSDIGLKA